MEESHPAGQRASVRWNDILRNFGLVLRNRQYLAYTLQYGFTMGVLFVNIASAPFIMQEHYGLSAMQLACASGQCHSHGRCIGRCGQIAHDERRIAHRQQWHVVAVFRMVGSLVARMQLLDIRDIGIRPPLHGRHHLYRFQHVGHGMRKRKCSVASALLALPVLP